MTLICYLTPSLPPSRAFLGWASLGKWVDTTKCWNAGLLCCWGFARQVYADELTLRNPGIQGYLLLGLGLASLGKWG